MGTLAFASMGEGPSGFGSDVRFPERFIAGWAYSPPTINGTLSAIEWRNATTIGFNINYNIGQSTNGTLYVMNDERNLYLAVKIKDTTFNDGDNLDLFFDNNNTGALSNGDDALQFDVHSFPTSNIEFGDEFRLTSYIPTGRQEDSAAGGTIDGTGAGMGDGQYNYFEFSHTLCSSDFGHDFCLRPGGTVGLLVGYDEDSRIGSYWPSQSPGFPDYSERAEITIATRPLTGTLPDFSLLTDGLNPRYLGVPVPLYGGIIPITIYGTDHSKGQIALSATSNSTGLIPWFQPRYGSYSVVELNGITSPFETGPQNSTFLLYNVTMAGYYHVEVAGASGNIVRYLNIYVNATRPTGDFSISAEPQTITVRPGGNATVKVQLTATGNFTGNVFLSPLLYCKVPHSQYACFASSDPFGPQVFANPQQVHLTVNGTAQSTVTIETPALPICCAVPSYVLSIGASGDYIDSVYNVTVNIALPDFNVSVSPSNLIVTQGGSAALILTVTGFNNMAGPVSLASSSNLVFFNPGSVRLALNGTATSNLRIVTADTISPGSYSVTITVSGGRTSHNATLQVLVASPLPAPQTILGLNPPIFYGLTGIAAGAIALSTLFFYISKKRHHRTLSQAT